jgi:hypothetical protein
VFVSEDDGDKGCLFPGTSREVSAFGLASAASGSCFVVAELVGTCYAAFKALAKSLKQFFFCFIALNVPLG